MTLNTNVSPEEFPKYIQLRGLPIVSRLQFSILLALYDPSLPDARQCFTAPSLPEDPSQRSGYRASLKAMVKRDYIMGNRGAPQYWMITPRGVTVLKEILRRCQPKDAARRAQLCCRCKQQPRYQQPGRRHSWCLTCLQAYDRQHRSRPNPDLPCARCKAAARCFSAGGIASPYCAACKPVVQKEKRQAALERDRARVAAGDTPTCKCGQPVYVTANYISRRCKTCEWAHGTRHRRKWWQNKKRRVMTARLKGNDQ